MGSTSAKFTQEAAIARLQQGVGFQKDPIDQKLRPPNIEVQIQQRNGIWHLVIWSVLQSIVTLDAPISEVTVRTSNLPNGLVITRKSPNHRSSLQEDLPAEVYTLWLYGVHSELYIEGYVNALTTLTHGGLGRMESVSLTSDIRSKRGRVYQSFE